MKHHHLSESKATCEPTGQTSLLSSIAQPTVKNATRQSPKLPQIVPEGGHTAHVALSGPHGDSPCNGAGAVILATMSSGPTHHQTSWGKEGAGGTTGMCQVPQQHFWGRSTDASEANTRPLGGLPPPCSRPDGIG